MFIKNLIPKQKKCKHTKYILFLVHATYQIYSSLFLQYQINKKMNQIKINTLKWIIQFNLIEDEPNQISQDLVPIIYKNK